LRERGECLRWHYCHGAHLWGMRGHPCRALPSLSRT
jgi:hypothetical protein